MRVGTTNPKVETMDRLAALDAHLRTMPPERVADILSTIPDGAVRYRTATPDTLLDLIMILALRPTVFERLPLPHHQILRAVVAVAENAQELLPGGPEGGWPRRRRSLAQDPFLLGPVDHEALLAKVDADSPGLARMRAEECVSDLLDLAILWPDGDGGYHLPDDAGYQFGMRGYPWSVEEALDRYGLATLRRMALALGLDPTGDWWELRKTLADALTDEQRVVSLVRDAPHEVRHRILQLTFFSDQVEIARTHLAWGMDLPVDGTGDDEQDWLLEHGLLLPTDYETDDARVFEVAREVALTIRRSFPHRFDPAPPQVMGPPAEGMPQGRGPGAVEELSREALTFLAGADTRLVAALTERPGRLRRDGHLAVPSRRRLTKAVGGNEDLARTWLEVGARTGLLIAENDHVTLSDQARAWSAAAPEVRLVALLEGWARRAEDGLWWPTDDEPVSSGAVEEGADARSRWAVVCALTHVPDGITLGIDGARATRDLAEEDKKAAGTEWLLSAAHWYQPLTAVDPEHEFRVLRAFREAEFLGVVCVGAATRVGRALSQRIRSAPRVEDDPGEGVLAAVRETLGLGAPEPGESWGGPLDLVGPEHARHRELTRWARELFGRPWTSGRGDADSFGADPGKNE